MSNNILEGGLPIQLSNMENLGYLDISENRLSGSILASSFNLARVGYLYMQKNAFNGSIPNAFFKSSSLLVLDLRDNKLSGSIPNQIDDKFPNRFLLLGGNHLEGHIPLELCKLRNMHILDLSRNRLTGSVPSCFSDMLFWTVKDASENDDLIIGFGGGTNTDTEVNLQVGFVTKNRYESYEGSILIYMTGLDLSSNELTGDIPKDIGNLQQIKAMNLSHNFLSGSIPESFSNLTNIESLDLSHNKLSGRIPPQLTQLNSLAIFNVSINNLSGPVPDKGQFGTFDESNYGGNPGLYCGPQIKRNCVSSEPTTPPATPSGAGEEEDESAIDMVSFYWSLLQPMSQQ
ncbi:hypothetical protein LWI29_025551 [Acer saccharum]|uniref:Uncharacterized protein n=1 Tax=Acer saccharum TaxID=4024 RepID=A0AA39VU11_ACESA|nr:hypothetical protein LWI29_025551 [Acer saccharum]